MTAAEARAISDMVVAKQMVRSFLEAIEQTAKEGRYEWRFGMIEPKPKEERALTLLGFRVMKDESGNAIVSWADAGERG